MKLLEQLAATLREACNNSISASRWEDQEALGREHGRLVSWIGGGSGNVTPGEDRVALALEEFLRTQELKSMSQARLISFGCTQRFNGSRRLIENRKHFGLFLEYVDSNRDQLRSFRKCYRGLLHGYFSYDPMAESSHEDGRQNWRDLRDFLAMHRHQLSITDIDPDWVNALNSHKNLLSGDPCSRYGTAALRGDRTAFDEIRLKLEVRDDSWVINSLIDAQIDAAVKLPDSEFKHVLEYALSLIKEHPLIVDRALGRLINRYAACSTREVNIGLRDFSVLQWKNPWLPSNAARWGSVEVRARDMIADWLKLQLITQFFSLLAEDGSNDTRRVEFWKGYHDKIQDMYFALGDTAFYNQSRDFQEIRKSMEGRLMRLTRAGLPTNNAFIMMIGDYVVVEFGTVGNAAYIFRSGNELPFSLSGTVAGNTLELKNSDCDAFVDRLIHRDTNSGSWEDCFGRILSKRVGQRPAQPQRTYPKDPPEIDPIRANTGEKLPFETALRTIASQHGLMVTDNRAKGGAIWAVSQRPLTAEAKERLEVLGFRWSERRRAYYKSD